MKQKSYSASQIIGILKEAESGMPVPEYAGSMVWAIGTAPHD